MADLSLDELQKLVALKQQEEEARKRAEVEAQARKMAEQKQELAALKDRFRDACSAIHRYGGTPLKSGHASAYKEPTYAGKWVVQGALNSIKNIEKLRKVVADVEAQAQKVKDYRA